MPSPITRTHKNRRSARRNGTVNRPQPTTPINIASASAAGSTLTITFNQPVTLRGTPNYATDIAGADPVPGGAELTSPTTLEMTFDAPIAAATVVRIPYEGPSVRNASGGFVADSLFQV
jgi:hypothetical protein